MFGKRAKSTPGTHHRIGQRLAVMTASDILVEKRYRFYINNVKKLSGLPDQDFDDFYMQLIRRFVEFVQAFPEETDGFLGSMSTSGLLRALNVLHTFVTEFKEPTPLERFALFSACLLQQIERVVTRAKIFITDDEGAALGVWQPFSGSLVDVAAGGSYKIIPFVTGYHRMESSVRITLARQVMGQAGFLAIAENSELLMEWYELLLDEDHEGFLRLEKVLHMHREHDEELMDELAFDVEILESHGTEHGEAFLEWLREGLGNHSIEANGAHGHAHVAGGGFFIVEEGAFEAFTLQYNPGLVKWSAVSNEFKNRYALLGAAAISKSLQKTLGSAAIPTDTIAAGAKKNNFPISFDKKEGPVKKGILITDSKLVTKETKKSTHRKVPSATKAKVHTMKSKITAIKEFKATKEHDMTPKYR